MNNAMINEDRGTVDHMKSNLEATLMIFMHTLKGIQLDLGSGDTLHLRRIMCSKSRRCGANFALECHIHDRFLSNDPVELFA